MTQLVPFAAPITVAVPAMRPEPLDRLPGSRVDDPFLRLAAAWLVGHPTNTATAYRRDLQAWATWCADLGVHPLAAGRHHVDAWVRHLTTNPQPRAGRPASAATRGVQALGALGLLRLRVTRGRRAHPLPRGVRSSTEGCCRVAGHRPYRRRAQATAGRGRGAPHRTAALVSVLVFCGLRISEALGADVRDYSHDKGHRVLKVTRKGGKAGRVALAPPVVRALDAYLEERNSGPLFLARDGSTRYPYRSAHEQLARPCRTAGLPAGVTPHSLRHSYATESLHLGAALQDVQDALGHADPRTTRRYDRNRNQLDRSPNYLLAGALTGDGSAT